MGRLWMVVLAACLAWAAPAEAAELEGFGPIKFGMTKDDAWAAIGGKGDWTVLKKLRYRYPSDLSDSDFNVQQNFEDGRATDVSIDHVVEGGAPQFCLTRGLFIAAVIKTKYALAPTVRHGRVEPTEPLSQDAKDYAIGDTYAFAFDHNGGIQLIAHYTFDTQSCLVALRYFPPSEYTNPF